MAYNLLIVESPHKIKTISKYLKNVEGNWKVEASLGYITILPPKEYGLEFIGESVKAKWVYDEGKSKIISHLKELAEEATDVYIATDDDRAGEKIAKDLVEKLKLKEYFRVTFNEITQTAIIRGLSNPRKVDSTIAEAESIRAIIDREVGYPISEIIRYDFREQGIIAPSTLGVGRSISAALHILAENKKEVDAFEEEEYIRLKVWYQKGGQQFQAIDKTRFMVENNDNMQQMRLVKEQLERNEHVVSSYSPNSEERMPPEPLYTAELQNSAFNLYRFSQKHTMKLAQILYQFGYITYMRTDSNNISDEAYEAIVQYLYENYDEDDVLETKRKYKPRPNAKEGHEACRPTKFTKEYAPENIINIWKESNDKLILEHVADCLKLYELIWYRTLATQMQNAIKDVSNVKIEIAGNVLDITANNIIEAKLEDGSTKKLLGWMSLKEKLLRKSTLNEGEEWLDNDIYLPTFQDGERLSVIEVTEVRSHTKTPKQFGLGRFAKKCESAGIARPSSLDGIVPSLERKKCIQVASDGIIRVKKLGLVVDDWVTQNCSWLNNVENAKIFEDTLDAIEKGEYPNPEGFIHEYHQRVEDLKEIIGYVSYDEQPPSQEQRDFAFKIAEEKGIILGDEVLTSREKLSTFIENNIDKKERLDTLGKCPECDGQVVENDKAFGCNKWKENNCKFTIWKEKAHNFFGIYQKEINDSYLRELIMAAIRNKPLLFQGLINKKQESFDAKIGIKKDTKWGWQLNVIFPKGSKKEDLQEESLKIVKKKEDTTVYQNYSHATYSRAAHGGNENIKEIVKKEVQEDKKIEIDENLTTDSELQIFTEEKMLLDINKFVQKGANFLCAFKISIDNEEALVGLYNNMIIKKVIIETVRVLKPVVTKSEFNGRIYKFKTNQLIILCFTETNHINTRISEINEASKGINVFDGEERLEINLKSPSFMYKNFNDIELFIENLKRG